MLGSEEGGRMLGSGEGGRMLAKLKQWKEGSE